MRKINHFIPLFFTLLSLIGCSKDIDHRLEGKWQLNEVVRDGAVSQIDTVWYSFQNTLFELRVYNPARDSAWYMSGYRNQEENNLQLELVTGNTDLYDFLPRTDWTGRKRSFIIENLDNGKLTLRDGEILYRLKRY